MEEKDKEPESSKSLTKELNNTENEEHNCYCKRGGAISYIASIMEGLSLKEEELENLIKRIRQQMKVIKNREQQLKIQITYSTPNGELNEWNK